MVASFTAPALTAATSVLAFMNRGPGISRSDLIQKPVTQRHPQQPQHLVIDGRFLYSACLDRGYQRLGIHESGPRHLQIRSDPETRNAAPPATAAAPCHRWSLPLQRLP